LTDHPFFVGEDVNDGYPDAFALQQARAGARLDRSRASELRRRSDDTDLVLDLVACTDAAIRCYDTTDDEDREFYSRFQWINFRTLWTVWSMAGRSSLPGRSLRA
jgi:hypothetical protein